MAGSISHLLKNDGNAYRGTGLLDHMGDAADAIDEAMFILLRLTTKEQRDAALQEYNACERGEAGWPDWWQPEEDWR